MNRHQRRQHWKMTRKRAGDRRTMQPSNAFGSFGECIKAFADHVLQDAGAAPTIAISPLVWTIEDGCDTRSWYFHVASADSDGRFRVDGFHCRNDRDLAERSRIAMMVEFVARGPMVLHEFDDELRFAEFCEAMWPCERTTRIRADVERERAEDPRIGQQGEEQGNMFGTRPGDPWLIRPEDCGYEHTPTVYRACSAAERLELKQVAAGRTHVYRLLGRKPHTTKRGAEIELLVWEGVSCMACGQAFEVLSGRKVPRYLTRRCHECRHWRDPNFY